MLITAVRLDTNDVSRSLILALAEHVEQCFEQGMGASFSIQVGAWAPSPLPPAAAPPLHVVRGWRY